ncbi:family 20 glycosylhydrolase (plasmid) [Catenovulum sp. SX2]|uniref:family 20 glycosylhydrolase n=1 Tax=Catenovulum sp. SX2 TaxID=3398614 RepID=UPI003F872F4E
MRWQLCLISLMMLGCQPTNQTESTTNANQQQQAEQSANNLAAKFAAELKVNYQVLTNRADELCEQKYAGGACFKGQISLQLPYDLTDNNWAIYFSHVAPIRQDFSEEFDIQHINGDLHKLTPTKQWQGFTANKSYQARFQADFWHLSNFDPMPNYFVTFSSEQGEGQAYTIVSTKAVIDPQTGQEILPFVQGITDIDSQFKRTEQDQTKWEDAKQIFADNQHRQTANADIDLAKVANRIIPAVAEQELLSGELDSGELDLTKGYQLAQISDELNTQLQPAFARLTELGFAQKNAGVEISFIHNVKLPDEAYKLNISAEQIVIEYAQAQGAFYALQSIASLIDSQTLAPITSQKINDYPRYDLRGLHIDLSRNFHGGAQVKKLIRAMAQLKLNTLHLHLADDEGWRVEIAGLPELTELGAYRCFDLTEENCLLPQLGSGPEKQTQVNGYFSQAEYIELLQFADKHFIEVIPSFDMPGHSRAAVKAMELRYRKYSAQGDMAKATEFLLSDFTDKTQYESVQFYTDNTINVCMPSAMNFVDKVLTELQALHQQAGVPLNKYHLGADETQGAWLQSPICQQFVEDNKDVELTKLAEYFVEQVTQIIAAKGIQPAAWSDGLSHADASKMPKSIHSNVWSTLFWDGHKTTHQHINQGWDVVVSNPDVTYFDFPYAGHPDERGYYWASRNTNSFKVFQFMPDNVPVMAELWTDRQNMPYTADDTESSITNGKKAIGLQAHLWSETTRLNQTVDYMLFPRLLALAERAWHQADWELAYQPKRIFSPESSYFTQQKQQLVDWQQFALAVPKQLAKLEELGVQYRVAPPGGQIVDSYLHMNHIFPTTELQYRTAEQNWSTYTQPVAVKGEVQLRAVSALGQFYSRTIVVK